MHRRSVLAFTAVCALALVAMMLPAGAVDQQLRTDVIKLKFARPAQVMFMLGLYTMDDALQGRQSGWTKGQPIADKSCLVPDGVEFIMPYTPDRSLVVKGDAEGIEDLRALIGKLDVKPRHIALSIDVWKLTPSQVESLGIMNGSGSGGDVGGSRFAFTRKRASAELRAKLADLHSVPVASLSVTSENNIPATIAVDAGFQLRRIEFTMLPRVNNADLSVTMLLKLSVPEGPSGGSSVGPIEAKDSSQIQTTLRTASGETIVSCEPADADGESVLSLITPKVLD